MDGMSNGMIDWRNNERDFRFTVFWVHLSVVI